MDNFNKNENKAKKHTEPRNNPESGEESSSNDEDFSQDDNEANNTDKNKPDSSQNRPLSCTMVVNTDIQQQTEDELSQMLEKDLSVTSTSKERYSDDNSSAKDEISSNISAVANSDNSEIEEVSNSSSSDFSPYISKSNNIQQNQNDFSDQKPSSSSTFNDDLNSERVTFSDIDDDNVEEELTRKINKSLKQTSNLETITEVDAPSTSSDPKLSSYRKRLLGNVGIVRTTKPFNTYDSGLVSNSSSFDFSLYVFSDSSDDKSSSSSSFNDDLNSERVTFSDIDDDNVEEELTRKINKSPKQTSNLETITEVDAPSTSSDPKLSSYRKRLLGNVEIVRTTKPFNTYDSGLVSNSSSSDFSPYIFKSNNMQQNQNDSSDDKPSSSSSSNKRFTSSDIDDDNVEEEEYTQKISKGPKQTSSFASHATFSSDTLPRYTNYGKSSISHGVDLSSSTEQSIIIHTPSSSSNNNNNASSSIDASAELPKSAFFAIPSSSSHDVVASISGTVPLKKVVDTDSDNSISEVYEFMQLLQIEENPVRVDYQRPSASTEVDAPSTSSDPKLSSYRKRLLGNVEIVRTTKPFNTYDSGLVSNSSSSDFSPYIFKSNNMLQNQNDSSDDKSSSSSIVDLSSATEQSIIIHTPSSKLPKSAFFTIPSSSSHDVVASISGTVPLKEVLDTDSDNSIAEEYECMQMLQVQQDLVRSRKRKPLSVSDVSPSISNTRFDYERPSASSNIDLSTHKEFFGNLETSTEVDAPSTSSDPKLSRYRKRLLGNVEIVRTTKPFNTYDSGLVSNSSSGINLRYSLERAPLTAISSNASASSPSSPSIEEQEKSVSSTPSSSKVNNNRASSYEDSPKKLKTRNHRLKRRKKKKKNSKEKKHK